MMIWWCDECRTSFCAPSAPKYRHDVMFWQRGFKWSTVLTYSRLLRLSTEASHPTTFSVRVTEIKRVMEDMSGVVQPNVNLLPFRWSSNHVRVHWQIKWFNGRLSFIWQVFLHHQNRLDSRDDEWILVMVLDVTASSPALWDSIQWMKSKCTYKYIKGCVKRPQTRKSGNILETHSIGGAAVTWRRGFVNNFVRVPFAWLGSREAVELSENILQNLLPK